MRLVVIPAYLNPAVRSVDTNRVLLDDLEKKGALKGVEVDLDDGYFMDNPSAVRDEEFAANASLGMIKKVKEYSAMGKHDAIVIQGILGVGFEAARAVSKIPVTGQIHSAAHIASSIGARFSVIHSVATSALIIRHRLEAIGFGHKCASVRFIGHSTTYMHKFIRQYGEPERYAVPEVKKIIDDIVTQCKAAIDKERADTLIFGCTPLQIFENEARRRLDEAGYQEIPIVCQLASGIEMAKAMVNMKLLQVARAYPTSALKAVPEYW